MPDVDVVVTIHDANLERAIQGFLRLWKMPQSDQGGDLYPSIEDWISVKLEDYLLEIVNRGLVVLAEESVERITAI